jgi:DNA-directed RNA polymerase specialized sigma24 family protein
MAADEEDAVNSAFDSLFRRARQGWFERPGKQLENRDDLGKLLITITSRKALKLIRDDLAQIRGGGRVLRESELDGGNVGEAVLDRVEGARRFQDGQAIDAEPSPEAVTIFAEEFRRLLDLLSDDNLRQVAILKLEGNTDGEIAGRMGVVRRTIVRRLKEIREIWNGEIA